VRIGLFTAADPHGGGVYQYGLTMIDALEAAVEDRVLDDVLILCDSAASPPAALVRRTSSLVRFPDFTSARVRYPFLLSAYDSRDWTRLLWQRIRLGRRSDRAVNHGRPRIHRQFALATWFDRAGVDLMVYALPAAAAFETDVPYVFVVHDLQHRVNPHFPEFSAAGERERREYLYGNGIARATVVVTTCQTGKEDVLTYYGDRVRPDRIVVLPHAAPSYLTAADGSGEPDEARRRLGLPAQYIFYPAQFWPHKNHATLVEALARLRRQSKLEIPLVMTGSAPDSVRSRTLAELRSLADSLQVGDLLHFVGYLDDELVAGLYLNATALVMPTFAATANIPILEAWTLGCPVITSDIRGVRDQVGQAALLVDPRSPAAIADAIVTLWSDEPARERLVALGRQRLRERHSQEQFAQRLREILRTANGLADGKSRPESWRSDAPFARSV
jgi:glycosyltransferase involved in cell wall biosynthesis